MSEADGVSRTLRGQVESSALEAAYVVLGPYLTAGGFVVVAALSGWWAPWVILGGVVTAGATVWLAVGLQRIVWSDRLLMLVRRSVTVATLLASVLVLNWVTATAKENVVLKNRKPERIVERIDPNPALQATITQQQGQITKQDIEIANVKRDLLAASGRINSLEAENARLRGLLDARSARKRVTDALGERVRQANGLVAKCGAFVSSDFLKLANQILNGSADLLDKESRGNDAQRVRTLTAPVGTPRMAAPRCEPNNNSEVAFKVVIVSYILNDIIDRVNSGL